MTLAERLRQVKPYYHGVTMDLWLKVCAVVEASGEYRQSIMDDAGSYEEGQRWVEAGQRLEAALDALAGRMDEEGL